MTDNEVARKLIFGPADIEYHLESALQLALRSPGDIAECGVGHGHTSALLLGWLRKYDAEERTLHLFDVFGNFPVDMRREEDGKNRSLASVASWMKADADAVRADLTAHGGRFTIHKGRFADTFPAFNTSLCFAFIDVDLWASTCEALALCDRLLVVGGVAVIHDYDTALWSGVTRAVNTHIDPARYWLIKPDKQSQDRDYSGIAIALRIA